MDANQLFWATGIDNTKLNTNVNEAVAIFQKLSNNVKAELEKIELYYDKVQLKANLKFTNPVDSSMVASIREQMASLGKVIDDQTNRVANLSLTYDKAMSKISSSTSKLGNGGSSTSPIKESVDNVKADVARADKELSFLEKRFKYAASSIIAYGSFRWGKQFIDDMISVKGEFDQLRVAIDAFVGGSEKGAEIFGQLTRLAVKSPFELRDITNSAKQLLAYGTAADDVTNSVKMLSDVSAGSGQSIKDIAYLYGTSLTQGRLYARDLFQFANRGIPIYGELAKVMGVSTEKLMQMTKAGKVGFPELQKAIENMTAAGGKYYGLSDKLAETTYGKISNLKDKWSIALNEMGTETDGIVSTGVEGITALIANWENVVKAVEAVIIAYGSYKAAMSVGLLMSGSGSYTANYREAESLNILMSAQQRSNLVKQGYVLGSAEYTAAVKAEAAVQLQNAQASVVAADEQIVSLNALVVSKSAELLESEKIVLAKRAELEASILLGDQKAIEAAQTELDTAVKTEETLSSEANTVAKELNTAITEKQILADKVELITTVQDTAAKEANEGITEFLTAAKIRLTAVSARLNAVIAANPYVLAALAIASLVVVVWDMVSSATAAEIAQNKFNDTMNKVSEGTDNARKKFEDLLNTVKNKTAGDVAQNEAYAELIRLYPSIIKSMSIQQVMLMDSTKAQKEYNDELAYNEVIQKRIIAIEAKRSLEKSKENLKSMEVASGMGGVGAGNMAMTGAQKQVDIAQEFYNKAQKEADTASKSLHTARKYASEHIVKNKAYWEDIKNSAKAERDALDKSQENGKEWNRLIAIERNADKELTAWDSTSKMDKRSESAKTKAQKEAERQAKLVQEQNRLNNEILQNKEKLTDASKQAELDRAQAEIDVLEDGYAKKQAQIEANYNREIAKVKEKGDELLKVQQKIAYDQWLIANPNWVKEKKSFAMPTILSTENRATVTSLTGTAEMNRTTESKKMYEKLLIDLQNFDQQRTEIDKKYNDEIAYLNKKRIDDNAIDLKNLTETNSIETEKRVQKREEETNAAISEAQRLAKEEKAKISLEELQKDINWGDVFSDLDRMSTKSLKSVRDQIKKFVKDFNGDLSKVDTKEVVKALESMDEKIAERSPFSSLSEGLQMYEDSSKRIKESQDKVNKLSLGKGEVATKALAIATDELTKAQNDNATSKVKMNNSIHAMATSGQQVVSAGQDIIETLELFGVKVSDGTKMAIKGAGDLMTAFSELDVTKPMTIITSSIKATKAEAEILVGLFGGGKGTENYEKLKASLESYMDVLDKVVDKQKNAMDKLSGPAVLAAQQELEATINKQIESYRKLAEAAGGAGASMGSHSYAYRTNKALKDSWGDISKSAGQTIDDINDMYSLSSSQLEKIMTDNPLAWSKIDSDIRGYLESIIKAGDSITESIDKANQALTGISFDSAIDGLDELLNSADTTMSDIADNFEVYMRTAMLNIVKSKYLTEALGNWYDKFVADTTSGNELTNEEVDSLRQAYIDIYRNAQSQYNALLDAADITLTGSSNSTSGAISSMSQESADILTAQFSAIRINVSDILLTLQSERPLLELAFNDIAEIARNTRDLADIKRLIGDIKDYGVKMK